jgi:release factor glutamine methyltransferase
VTIAVAIRIGALRRRLAAVLEVGFAAEHRSATPALDARLLVAEAIGIDATGLALHDDQPVDEAAEARAIAFVERRLVGEPVARIIARQEFWGLELEIGPDTLVPRPDTETLVEAALGFIDSDGRRDEALSLLDIGTGSGAILLALLSELPKAEGIATDRVASALTIARDNARRLGLAKRAGFIAGNWAEAVGGPFDLVLANPPYIESEMIAGLQIEVRNHDPHVALDGGADGLDAYRAILVDLDRLMARRGRSFLEVGFDQGRQVADLAEKHGFSTRFHRDLGGIDRVVEMFRTGND